jgi:hypothetical protein
MEKEGLRTWRVEDTLYSAYNGLDIGGKMGGKVESRKERDSA